MEGKIKPLPFTAQWPPHVQMPAVGLSGIVRVGAGGSAQQGRAWARVSAVGSQEVIKPCSSQVALILTLITIIYNITTIFHPSELLHKCSHYY